MIHKNIAIPSDIRKYFADRFEQKNIEKIYKIKRINFEVLM